MSSLSELRTRARRRADAVGNNFFSDAEINDYINIGMGELHDILVSKQEDYFVSKVSFSLVDGQAEYSFASINLSNFYKALGVDSTQGSDTFRVKRFSLADRNKYQSNIALHNSRGYADYQYAIQGNSIRFLPEPSSTDTITLWYIPEYVNLVNDTDETDSRINSNWEEYAIISSAIKMRQKEETSTTSLERDLDRIVLRIEEASSNRDSAEPFGITDESVGVLPGYWT